MRIDTLIEELNALRCEHGNIEVAVSGSYGYPDADFAFNIENASEELKKDRKFIFGRNYKGKYIFLYSE